MSDIADTDLIFDGLSGITGYVLVRTIRRRILVERIHQDDELIALTAASYFQGPALDWFEDQSEETQESWKLLRRAILTRWPSSSAPPAPTPSSPTSNIPTPAAAPPNAATTTPILSSQAPLERDAPRNIYRNGRIRVESMEGITIGYISTVLDVDGHCQLTSVASNIAIVELIPNGRLVNMQIKTHGIEVVSFGARLLDPKSSERLIKAEATCGALVTVTGRGSSSTRYDGDWSSNIWSISADGQIFSSWEVTPNVRRDLAFAYRTMLSVINDFEGFKKMFAPDVASKLRIVQVMEYWRSLPDELIIRVLLILIDDPKPILGFAQTSKRHNAIATDDTLWLHITAYIFKWFGIPSVNVDEAILRQNRSRILTHVQPHQNPYHQLYVRLLGPYRWLLGWWIIKDHVTSDLCRVYVRFTPNSTNDSICSIVGHPIVTAFNSYKRPEGLHPAVRYIHSFNHHDGFYVASLVDQSIGIAVYGHNAARIKYPDDPQDGFQWFFEVLPSKYHEEIPTSKRVHRATTWDVPAKCTLIPLVNTSPWEGIDLNCLFGRLFDSATKFNDAPFPSPSSIFVVPGVQFDKTTGSHIIPRSTWEWHEGDESDSTQFLATPMHSPSFYPPETNEILTTGIYMTPGAVARRFVFLRIRELTEEDFVESWPWEGHFGSSSRGERQLTGLDQTMDWTDPDVHLGPFSAVRCTSMETRFPRLVSEEHVRPGARIVEVTKLAGGGAPSGQRTVIAFLQDPRVSPDRLAEIKAQLPLSHRDLPEGGSPPWPISRKAMEDPTTPSTTASVFQTPFAPERGIDLPSLGRVAHGSFIQPSWMDVIVHVESRDQFTVFWQDLDNYEVYTKMSDI